ncbi:MAG: cation:proton antiporter [Flavobacteriales bacterium]|nr:cation:proton antiporter [Flavobacteriales bacterium]
MEQIPNYFKFNNRLRWHGLIAFLIFFTSFLLADSHSGEHGGDVITSVGIAILGATVVAFLGHIFKQPLLLAYIAAGIIIGPKIGLGLIKDEGTIETISHFGLILLLFLIGLEIDIKKLKSSGASLLLSGALQFPLTVLMGLGFFMLLGYSMEPGKYDLLYLAICCGLASTAIVVKLLYSKFELDTLPGRITLGILVFQDLWAIIVLGIQPNLSHPDVLQILLSFVKGGLLVAVSLLVSKYVLPKFYSSIAKIPELVLVSSLGWCFLVCGGAAYLNLSLEMGALIAGVAISTFPYNLDVIAKVVNIRDFFVTLFFVSLGMQIPNPMDNPQVLLMAGIASLFLVVSRFLSIFPILHRLKNGNRVSLITPINLSQISEFSLVIAALGVTAGHISDNTLSIIIFVFVITSISSTYMIKFSDGLQKFLSRYLIRLGIKDKVHVSEQNESIEEKEIALLGFHRTASSLIHEILALEKASDSGIHLKEKIVVVDFNPEIRKSLNDLGINVVYGDISHMDTLHHAGIHDVKIVISTIPDSILVGTDNFKIIKHIKEICPHARIVVTADSTVSAVKMYEKGADYVFIPRILAAQNVIEMIDKMMKIQDEELREFINNEIALLEVRQEVIS